jgi:hypothetical protein
MVTRYTVCSADGCPNFSTRGGRCDECRRAAERMRGTRQERGYDSHHDRLRAEWAPKVARLEVTCWRCGEMIGIGQPWHLGHDDDDRTQYRGPEHAWCNLGEAGRRSPMIWTQ